EQLIGATVTANFFHTLGVKAKLGRTFLPDEDGMENPSNAAHTTVISYRLWQDVLGADPNILGRTVELNHEPYVIVGVLPEDVNFRLRPRGLYIPAPVRGEDRDYHYVLGIGRMRTSLAAADAELKTIAANLANAYPKSNRGWTAQVEDLPNWLVVNRT